MSNRRTSGNHDVPDTSEDRTLLTVRGLSKTYSSAGRVVHAVRDVSFSIDKGTTLGLVGESGSGKSTTGKCVLRLTVPTAGDVWLAGRNLAELSSRELREFRKRMQTIFQDPYASLNPRMTVLDCVREPLFVHKVGTARDQIRRATELLDTVGISEQSFGKRPSGFSGGQLQRVGIARALALNPDLIVCDEPVSALDVSIQAQVLNLLKDLQDQLSLTYLFISHDLSVIRDICDDVCVMRDGTIVEAGTTTKILSQPTHEYTQTLLSAALLKRPLAT